MFRIVLIDVTYGQGFCPDDPRTVYETFDIIDAYQKHAEYVKEYPYHKVVLEQALPSVIWERIK